MASGSGYVPGVDHSTSIPTKSNSAESGFQIGKSNTNGTTYNSGLEVLSPPGAFRTMSLSPGTASEYSNEASGGHSGFSPFQITSSTLGQAAATSTANATSTSGDNSSTQIFRGGFDKDSVEQSNRVGEGASGFDAYSHIEQSNNRAGPSNASGSTTLATSEPLVNGASGQGQATSGAMDEMIPTTFDEATLRALCDMDCGMPLLYDRIKQSMVSANHASAFFKKRAAIEEEYARNMIKLAKSTAETYATSEAKAGTYVKTWHSFLRTHEILGDSRMRLAIKLTEMSDELANLAKEVDKNRKYAKETGTRLERNLTEAEMGVEKSRHRFDAAAEELERLLLLKSGESTKGGELQGITGSSGPPGKRTLGKAIGKSGLLFKNKNPQQIQKQEEDMRSRTSTASDAFRKEVLTTQGIRQEYFNLQLPRILRSLKESAEEIDNGLQYHLSRYAFLYESTVLTDAMAITPVSTADGAVGLKMAVETIDNRVDFKTFMQNYSVAHGRDYRGPRREGPYEEGFVPSMPAIAKVPTSTSGNNNTAAGAGPSKPIFGVPLADQMARDMVEVPPILEKCAEAIESVGIENMGIYRLSGTTSKVQKLKAKFDADWSAVDLTNDEAINDINIVAGCLKLWFRELPEPLMTWDLYQGFIDAARVENERMRHIRMHERVNDLPDANYATLKYLMGHLDKVKAQESLNQMSASNLAIVFGPTLLSPTPQGNNASGGAAPPDGLEDMGAQCLVIQVILERYEAIFVDDS